MISGAPSLHVSQYSKQSDDIGLYVTVGVAVWAVGFLTEVVADC